MYKQSKDMGKVAAQLDHQLVSNKTYHLPEMGWMTQDEMEFHLPRVATKCEVK